MTTFNGDCLEVMRDFSDNIIDLLFCDLPYGQTDCKWDCKINLDTFWKEVNRICKLNCPMFFTTTARFGVELINSNPKNFRYDLVWVKTHNCGFLNAKKMPMRKHEMIYVFYRKLPLYDLSSHSYNNEYKGEAREFSVIKTDLVSNILSYRNKAGLYDPPLPNSILEIKSEKGKHATQKPVDLIKWILKYYSKEGDTVLDPTMGSGTTLIACKQMNRKYIGIEKDEKIYKDAVERINKILL